MDLKTPEEEDEPRLWKRIASLCLKLENHLKSHHAKRELVKNELNGKLVPKAGAMVNEP